MRADLYYSALANGQHRPLSPFWLAAGGSAAAAGAGAGGFGGSATAAAAAAGGEGEKLSLTTVVEACSYLACSYGSCCERNLL